jgi:hypothetical protein
VARRRDAPGARADLDTICAQVDALCADGGASLAHAGWSEALIGLVVFGRGAAQWADSALPEDPAAVRAGLAAIAAVVRARFPAFRLTRRRAQ